MDHALCLTALRLGELGRDHDQAQVEHEERTDLTTAPRRRKQQRHVCVQLPIRQQTNCSQQSLDVICPPGPQQQTRRTLLQRSIDGTDGQTDGQTDGHRTVLGQLSLASLRGRLIEYQLRLG